jgi:hypothetical protein
LSQIFGIPIALLPTLAMAMVFIVITFWAEPQIKRLGGKRRGPLFLLRLEDLDLVESAIQASSSNSERVRLQKLHRAIRIAFACWLLGIPVGLVLVVADRLLS